jgi:hypothetical protein
MNHIAVDFETFYVKGDYDIKTLGAAAYVRDPRFDCYLISVSDGEQNWSGHPNEFNWESLEGAILLSHNQSFDSRVYRELVLRGKAPNVEFADWICTANLSAFLCMRRDLARASEFLLGSVVDKSYRTDANGKTWDDMVKAGVAEKVKEAGRVDALRCWQLWQKFGHLWPERERKLSKITIDQCATGCALDTVELKRQLFAAQRALIQADSVLPWVAAGGKPTSPKAIAEECRKVGIPCPPVKTRDGEEAYDKWAADYVGYEWVKAYTDYRVINKHITTLEKVLSRTEQGIFYYDLLYFGAHTGRWAGSGGFNLQNMRRLPLLLDWFGLLVTDTPRLELVDKSPTLPYFVAHSLDVRKLFVARPGYRMMAPDLSQIEPRVLAWVVEDEKMLSSMAAGKSPYQAHAESTMNWTGGELKKENKGLYALAKARVLGLGYACGWKKFITVAQALAGLDITVDDPKWVQATNDDGEPCVNAKGEPIMVSGYGMNSRRIVKEFRDSNPLLASNDKDNPGFWRMLDNAFRDHVGRDFEIPLPSGRSLRYPEVQKELKRIPDPDRPGRWLTKTVYTALAFDEERNAVIRKSLYGGLLCENIVQAIARDVFGECVIRLNETPGINVLWTVHDEAVIEARPDISEEDVRRIMCQPVSWMPGLPVDCEVKVIPHYTK